MHKNQASRILPTVRMAMARGRETIVYRMPGAETLLAKGKKDEGEQGKGTDRKYRGSHQNGKGTGCYLWPDGGDPGREDENGMNDRTASCPYCGTRHFWKRPDRKEIQEKGEVRIDCRCGEHYWVVMNKDGRGSHIRANRRKE